MSSEDDSWHDVIPKKARPQTRSMYLKKSPREPKKPAIPRGQTDNCLNRIAQQIINTLERERLQEGHCFIMIEMFPDIIVRRLYDVFSVIRELGIVKKVQGVPGGYTWVGLDEMEKYMEGIEIKENPLREFQQKVKDAAARRRSQRQNHTIRDNLRLVMRLLCTDVIDTSTSKTFRRSLNGMCSDSAERHVGLRRILDIRNILDGLGFFPVLHRFRAQKPRPRYPVAPKMVINYAPKSPHRHQSETSVDCVPESPSSSSYENRSMLFDESSNPPFEAMPLRPDDIPRDSIFALMGAF